MEYSALICAAGSGTRMKLGYNKVYMKLKDGRSILDTTISVFQSDRECTQIIVVTDAKTYLKEHCGKMNGIILVKGGATRQESVRNGLLAVKNPYVMIHDGARPFVPLECIQRIKETLLHEDACLLMVPCKDTIKRVVNGYVEMTYDRSTLMCAQTPQAFRTDLITTCMKKAIEDHFNGTDDASLVEKYSDVKVKVVDGSYANLKITTIEDVK